MATVQAQRETVRNLIGKNLVNWKIVRCYFLETLFSKRVGWLRARTASGEIIYVLERTALRVVWDNLVRRVARVSSFLALVHEGSASAISLQPGFRITEGTKLIRIFSRQELENPAGYENPFRWSLAGGLRGFNNSSIKEPDFGN